MKKILLNIIALALVFVFISANVQVSFAQKNSTRSAAEGKPPLWKTLKQQLDQEYSGRDVIPGSELEKLIADNQNFSLLRADEAGDRRGLPPWLRVWWRKAHPEVEYSAADPTGGYPLVLKEILEWMMTHQDLKPGPGAEGDEAEKEGESEPDSVGANVRVSGLQSVARSESDIRINYFDTQKILAASNNIGGNGRQGIYYSTDGGANWLQTFLPLETGDAFHSDPTVEWTNDGRAYSSTLGINSAGSQLRMRNYYSTDNGATWTFDATVSGTQTNVDKQMVWVDHSSTSPFFGRQYAIWHNGSPAIMNRRTAGASGTWLTTPLTVSTGDGASGTRIGSDVKTNGAGDVFGFYPATGNRGLYVVKSTTGGDSFGTAVRIAATFDSFDTGIPAFNSRRALIYISGGAFKTATKDLVYASWTDLSGDTGCTAAANEPGGNSASTCKMRVWFARSTDGGATWAAPVKINNQSGLNDQFNQWMVVDETNGKLGIIYYDTVGDSGRKKTDIWFQTSSDDGVTWSTAEKVTTTMTDETIAGADSGNQYGDYNALSGYSDILFPSWTDRRNNGKEEVWTAKITPTTAAQPAELAGRVTLTSGFGVENAVVTLTDANNMTRSTRTNQFGFYHFYDLPTGMSYVVTVRHPRYQFNQQTITLNSAVTNFNFTTINASRPVE